MSIFKACDVRGVYPDQLDEQLAEKIGRAIGSQFKGTCVLGGDLRPSTSPLKKAVSRGLQATGIDVVDIGLAPTPAVYWAQREFGHDGAVIVTASHNPAEYNGIKFALGPRPTTPDVMRKTEILVHKENFAEGKGSFREKPIKDGYLAWVEKSFRNVGTGLHVVVDAGNGCASEWAPLALSSAGCEVIELNCEPDGTFPNRSPNPAKPEALRESGCFAASKNADFTVAFDGDADRAVFLDENGEYVDSDKSLIILARDLLAHAEDNATVVYDVKCSDQVPEQIRAAGGCPVAERSGYAFIKSRLLDENALFAGEASGHFFFRELGGDDGTYAALKMASLLARKNQPFSEILQSIPPYYITPDIRMPRPGGDGRVVIEKLKNVFSNRPQNETDGVRIDFEHGWALCRESVTEPVVTLRFEGETPEDRDRIKERVISEIPPV
ncbi:MAG: phosphomannomutase/phosphoglucomutase [Candidatus Brocadiia bacterium]